MQTLPYLPISAHYFEKFRHKVQKIPVTIASDCPNRLGLKNMKICSFCDVWGSAAYPEQQNMPLESQIKEKISEFKLKYNKHNFLVYFQSYTSTFMSVKSLESYFDEALLFPEVKGIVIGTRPDCISQATLDLWQKTSQRTYFAVELGVQSFFEPHLEFYQRGHTAKQSIDAISKIRKVMPEVNLGVHLIFGAPNETDEEIIKTAQIVSELKLDNVKLHNLHVLKNTQLEKIYLKGEFQPIDLDEYTRRVILFLEHLDPKIYVHRLTALSTRSEELIAPKWTSLKMMCYQFIVDQMKKQGSFQGRLFQTH